MAFIKPIPTDFGVAASYWRIVALNEDLLAQALDVTLQGCFDEAARRAGAPPMAVWRGRIEGDLYRQTMGLAEVYRALAQTPDWCEAAGD